MVSGWAMQPLVDYSYNYNWPTAWQLPNILYWNQKKLCYKKELKVVQFVFFVSLTKQLSPLKGHCHEKSIQFISQGTMHNVHDCPKVINFTRYNTKCCGEHVIHRGIFVYSTLYTVQYLVLLYISYYISEIWISFRTVYLYHLLVKSVAAVKMKKPAIMLEPRTTSTQIYFQGDLSPNMYLL